MISDVTVSSPIDSISAPSALTKKFSKIPKIFKNDYFFWKRGIFMVISHYLKKFMRWLLVLVHDLNWCYLAHKFASTLVISYDEFMISLRYRRSFYADFGLSSEDTEWKETDSQLLTHFMNYYWYLLWKYGNTWRR